MTFEEAMIENMTTRGMFQTQAKKIMDKVITENLVPQMKDKWDTSVAFYPYGFISVLWLTIKPIAYEWLEENEPMAWFKPMFQYTDSELKQLIESRKESADSKKQT